MCFVGYLPFCVLVSSQVSSSAIDSLAVNVFLGKISVFVAGKISDQ